MRYNGENEVRDGSVFGAAFAVLGRCPVGCGDVLEVVVMRRCPWKGGGRRPWSVGQVLFTGQASAVFLAVILSLGLAVGPAVGAGIPNSGQTQCYDDTKQLDRCPAPGEPFYGQDGNYALLRPPKYVKLDAQGNELPDTATVNDGWVAVRDEVTGLVWQVRWPSSGFPDDLFDTGHVYTWCRKDSTGATAGTCRDTNFGIGDTAAFLAALNDTTGAYTDFTDMPLPYAGHTDWRLPTVAELVSLVDYGRSTGPAIDLSVFPNAASAFFWTSEPKEAGTVWTVGFSKGLVLAQVTGANLIQARAVRGAGVLHDFVDNGDGTITDRATGLMWTAAPIQSPTGGYTWRQALAVAEEATVAGYDDWRLPSIKEWAFLIDRSRGTPTLPAVFVDTMWLTFWTATTYAPEAAKAWYVNTANGLLAPQPKDQVVASLRLVRDIPLPVAPGDVDGSGGAPDLRDAVILLGILAGLPVPDGVTIHSQAAVDGSGRLGPADLVYILRRLAGL